MRGNGKQLCMRVAARTLVFWQGLCLPKQWAAEALASKGSRECILPNIGLYTCTLSAAAWRDVGFFTTLIAAMSPAFNFHCGKSNLLVPSTTLAKLPLPSFRPSV